MDREDRREALRKEVTDADDTGMIANEELIAQVETRPVVPHEDLHAALPSGHPGHATIDKLHAEMRSPVAQPSSDRGARNAPSRNSRARDRDRGVVGEAGGAALRLRPRANRLVAFAIDRRIAR